jgi:hypothetical protein
MWSFFLGLASCTAGLSIPFLLIGARSLQRWAPTHDVRRFARLLFVAGIGQAAVVVTVIVGLIVFGTDPPVAALVPVVVIGAMVGVLDLVAWIGCFRALARWAGGTHIVAAWNRTIRFLPLAWIAIGIAIALVVIADAPSVLIAPPAAWAFWMVGHPSWWTHRLFDADLRAVRTTAS